MMFSLPVLMYHSISRYKHRLCVSPELFEEQCACLARAGWRGISLEEAERYFLKKRRLPGKTCLFTFDDGYLDNYVHAEPILRGSGHQGVMFTVCGCLNRREVLRPTRETTPDSGRLFPGLDRRRPVRNHSGYKVVPILFCSWREVRAMRSRGSMDVAPHSMLHARVISDLHFTRLYAPNNRHTFFHTAPYPAVWGMPRFKLNHGLVNKGYHLDPELFELVKRLVPQEPDQAQEFLTDEKNRAHVIEAIKKLPRLGVLETDTQYRERLASEFNACRETYEKMLGYTPVSFCWPWGSYNDTALGEARKAGFKVFFTTLPGMNPYGRSRAVRRFAVREGSGEELLSTVKKASSVWQVLPDELERLGRRLWARVVPD